jgi:hypothetical protein
VEYNREEDSHPTARPKTGTSGSSHQKENTDHGFLSEINQNDKNLSVTLTWRIEVSELRPQHLLL